MKRVLLRTALVIAVVAVFIGGTLTLIRSWSASRLEGYKRHLQAKGEKLLPSDFISGPVVSNALLTRIATAYRQIGRAAPGFHLIHTSCIPVWKGTNDWLAMHQALDAAAGPLAEIREAIRLQPRDLGWDQTNWNTYPNSALVDIRRAAQWLMASAVIELHRGRIGEAVTNLLGLLDLARCHADERNLVYQMIRVALIDMAYASSWELLQARGWTDANLAQLQMSWQRIALLTPLELALQMERARGLEYFAQPSSNLSDGLTVDPLPDSFSEAVYTPLWNLALSAGDQHRFLLIIQASLDGLRVAREKSSVAELSLRLSEIPERSLISDYRYPMASISTGNFKKALTRAIKTQVHRGLVIAAIGLERYRLRHSRYPEKLEELVPEILAEVPVDFGDGKQLRYKGTGEHYELWSVWENLRWPHAAEPNRNE